MSLSQELNRAFVDQTGDQCGNPSAAQELRDQVTSSDEQTRLSGRSSARRGPLCLGLVSAPTLLLSLVVHLNVTNRYWARRELLLLEIYCSP